MKVLVCGGRHYANWAAGWAVLSELHATNRITKIVTGGAAGADAMAIQWAIKNKVACQEYPADWKQHYKAAGPIRNSQMLRIERPDLVIAFPGGKGTANMLELARNANVTIMEVKQ